MTRSVEFMDVYRHFISAKLCENGEVAIRVDTSPIMDGGDRSAHLNLEHVGLLLSVLDGAPGPDSGEVGEESPAYNDRGFSDYGVVATQSGVELTVRQSSNAEEDCVWIFQHGPDDTESSVEEYVLSPGGAVSLAKALRKFEAAVSED
jgi:hypothetical protein